MVGYMAMITGLSLPNLSYREDGLLKDLGLVFEIPLEDDPAIESSSLGLGKRIIQVVGLPDFASEKELIAVAMAFGMSISRVQFKRIFTEFFCAKPSKTYPTGTHFTNGLLDYFLSNSDAKALLLDSGMKIYERVKNRGEQYRFREPDLFGMVYVEKTIQDFLSQCLPSKCTNEKDKVKFYLSILQLLIQSCRFQTQTDVPCKQGCIQVLLQLKNPLEEAFVGMFSLPSEEEADIESTGLTAQFLLALMTDLRTEEGESRFISLLRKMKRSWSFGDYAAFKQNAEGCPPMIQALEIAAHIESSIQNKMPSVYILSLGAFLGEKNVVESLRKKGHSIVQVVSKTHNPNYFRWVDVDINFISKNFEDGSHRSPKTEKHRIPICCYSEGRAKELFDFRYDDFEFCELSKEIDLLNALDQYTDSCFLGESYPVAFFNKEINLKARNVFNQFSKVISSWAKEKEIPGFFVPWFFVYRNSSPDANASDPFFLAHVDYTKEYLESPPKETKETWIAAARCVFGDMTEEEYDKYKRHTWINTWMVSQQLPSEDPVAIKKGLKYGTRGYVIGEGATNLGVLYDEEQEWIVENMRRGGTMIWRTDKIAHTAVKTKIEGSEKSHRKSFDIRGAFFSL